MILYFILGTILMLLACQQASLKNYKVMWFDIIISLMDFAIAIWRY